MARTRTRRTRFGVRRAPAQRNLPHAAFDRRLRRRIDPETRSRGRCRIPGRHALAVAARHREVRGRRPGGRGGAGESTAHDDRVRPKSAALRNRRVMQGVHMSSDEQQIRQLVSDWMAATKAGDVERVLSFMTDDVVFLTPGCPPMRKADFAAGAKAQASGQAPKFEGKSDIEEIIVAGDWAF